MDRRRSGDARSGICRRGFTALRQTEQLTSTVRYQDGGAITGASLTWSTSIAQVATVTSSGLVTAAGPGEAWITAASGSVRDSAPVSVGQVARSIAFSPTSVALAGLGDTATVAATVLDAGGCAIGNADLTKWSDPEKASRRLSARSETEGAPKLEEVEGRLVLRCLDDVDVLVLDQPLGE